MMQPFTTSEHEQFRDYVKNFAQRYVAPMAESAEHNEETPREFFELLGRQGFLCLSAPSALGGVGGDVRMSAIMSEELGYVNAGLASAAMVHSGIATSPIVKSGTAEQQKRYLPSAIKGDMIHAFALTEPDIGSDAVHIKTTAWKQDSGYVLRGTKMWITNGGIADRVVVAARVKEGNTDRGVTLFVVEKGMPGFSSGRSLKKLGHRSSITSELIFDSVALSESHRLGDEGEGFRILYPTLTTGRVIVGARAIGVAQAALDLAQTYAGQRWQFGQRISSFQTIRNKLADMATDIQAARGLVYHAAWLLDEEADAVMSAAMAKYYAGEMCIRVTNQALQVFGGYGYSQEFPVERLYRDARLHTIVEGTSEIQQRIIAKSLIGDET